jgi:hypothetical protein
MIPSVEDDVMEFNSSNHDSPDTLKEELKVSEEIKILASRQAEEAKNVNNEDGLNF